MKKHDSRKSHFFRIAGHIFAILLVTTINVRVRALTMEDPKNCAHAASGGLCAIHTQERMETLDLISATAKLSRGATVLKTGENEVKIIRGLTKVTAREKTLVKTLYGDMELSSGEVLIEVRDSMVKFTNLSSDVQYSPRGEGKMHKLPVGFANYFAGITRSGVAEAGYPKPAEIEQLIQSWSYFYSAKEKGRFSTDLKTFMGAWSEATKAVGPWYVEVVKREIAAQEAEEARLARLKAEQEVENNKYRNMFRQRIFNDW